MTVVLVPLQIGVVFNLSANFEEKKEVLVPLQIGVVFNVHNTRNGKQEVLVPLQIGVVFNKCFGKASAISCSRPLTNRGSL